MPKSMPIADRTVIVRDLSNQQFLEKYAKAGRVGLVGGVTLIEKAIRRAQRHLDKEERWSLWSHAMVFEGQRLDGHHWIIESDVHIHHKNIRLGVQENRINRYFDASVFPTLAVLDFDLGEEPTQRILREG